MTDAREDARSLGGVNVSHAKPLTSIRALVVDDEVPARRYLTLLLRRDPDIGSVIQR